MKKLIAVILAVLLLGSAVAYAEAAPVLDLKDPVLEVAFDGETGRIDLAGLTLRFGVLGEGDEACLILNILGGDELLLRAAARMDGGRVLLAADGLSHTYATALPAAEFMGSSGKEEESPVAGLMETLMSQAEIGTEGEATTFRLPYTAVNDLLRELLPMLDKVPNAEELIAEFGEMEAQGQGFELNGSVTMSGGFHLKLDVTPVGNGEAAPEPARRLLVDLEQLEDGADFFLTLLAPSEGEDPVFREEGRFRTDEEQGLSVHVDVFADAAAVSAGAPSAVLDLAAGEDFSLKLELPGTFRFAAGFARADDTLALEAETADFRARLTMTAVSGEEELEACAFPADVIELGGELSEEQQEELSGELMTALSPVLSFLMPALSESGVLG